MATGPWPCRVSEGDVSNCPRVVARYSAEEPVWEGSAREPACGQRPPHSESEPREATDSRFWLGGGGGVDATKRAGLNSTIGSAWKVLLFA